MRFLVVAVDGVLVDTLPARAAALQFAAHSLKVTLEVPPHDDEWIAGLGFAEAARTATARDAEIDETLIDLLAIAAERALQHEAAKRAPLLMPESMAQCAEAAARGWRVVLRTDATRRVAGPLLEHLLTELNASRAIAADDVRPGAPLLRQQYARLAPSWRRDASVWAVEASRRLYDVVRREVPALHAGWPST